MTEGCNLFFTKEDFGRIQNSLDTGLPTDQKKFASASSLLRSVQKANFNELMKSLSCCKHSHYKLVNNTLIKSFGKGKVTAELEAKLNRALYIILEEHPNPQGLFEKSPKNRGTDSTSVDHPYEILCAAALVQARSLKNVKSSTGHSLVIYSTDRLDLGQKSPSNDILSTAAKGTIKPSILIQRQISIVRSDIIGVDARYTKETTYDLTKKLMGQLNGIKSALQNKYIVEFHFVTNAQFSTTFKKMVDNVNRELIADAMENNTELYHGIRDIISGPKRETISAVKLAAELDFQKDRGEINSLIDNRVPQIGYCEKVNFK